MPANQHEVVTLREVEARMVANAKAEPAPGLVWRCIECGATSPYGLTNESAIRAAVLVQGWVETDQGWLCSATCLVHLRRSLAHRSQPVLIKQPAPKPATAPVGPALTRRIDRRCARPGCGATLIVDQTRSHELQPHEVGYPKLSPWSPDETALAAHAGWKGTMCSAACAAWIAASQRTAALYEPMARPVERINDASYHRPAPPKLLANRELPPGLRKAGR